MSVAVLGSINLDVVCVMEALPRPKETALARRLDYFLGGKGANQAAAASKLGARTRLIGAVGGDQDGQFLLRELSRLGVDCAAVRTMAGEATGRAFVFVDAEGQNTIVVAPGANAADDPAQDEDFACDVLLAQFERPIGLIERVFTRHRGAPWRIVNAAPFVAEGRAALALANVVLVNEAELCGYAGVPVDAALDNAEFARIARTLLASDAAWAIVTLGARGALAVSASRVLTAPGLPAAVVDTTGAGDCFAGALAAALDAHADMERALRFANAAAAVSVERRGAAQSMPTTEEVLRRLAG